MTYFFYYGKSGYCLVPFVWIRRGFAPCFVNYKRCTRLAAASDTSCLLMIGGSLQVLRPLPLPKLVAMI